MVTETMTIKIFNLVKLKIHLVDFLHLLHFIYYFQKT